MRLLRAAVSCACSARRSWEAGRVQALHTVAEIRAAEQVLLDAQPEGTLMSRAATGLATVCLRLLRSDHRAPRGPGGARVVGRTCVAVVGAGNNGGDALFAGAVLAGRGVRVVAVLLEPDRAHPGGLAALRRAGGRTAGPGDLAALAAAADLVLDGIVGIGVQGALHGAAARAARILTAARTRSTAPVPTGADRAADRIADRTAGRVRRPLVVAVDLPSGVDADTGEVAGDHVEADVTVTFGALKVGLLVDPGAGAAGRVELVDIGLGSHLPEAAATLVQDGDLGLLPRPDRTSHKYSRGVLGLSAGSAGYPGAAVLAAGGALAGPIGMLRFVGPDDVTRAVLARHPEAVAGDGRAQAHAIGPGLGSDRGDEVRRLLTSGLAVLVDAGGLDALPDRVLDAGRVLITPHAGELARLLGVERVAVESRRLEHARRAAARLRVTVLLKGTTTVVADPDGRVAVSTGGTPYLATAGAGDVLTGFAGALLAAGLPPRLAGALGAHAHGLAATAAAGDPPHQIVAGDVAAALPAAVAAAAWHSDAADAAAAAAGHDPASRR